MDFGLILWLCCWSHSYLMLVPGSLSWHPQTVRVTSYCCAGEGEGIFPSLDPMESNLPKKYSSVKILKAFLNVVFVLCMSSQNTKPHPTNLHVHVPIKVFKTTISLLSFKQDFGFSSRSAFLFIVSVCFLAQMHKYKEQEHCVSNCLWDGIMFPLDCSDESAWLFSSPCSQRSSPAFGSECTCKGAAALVSCFKRLLYMLAS